MPMSDKPAYELTTLVILYLIYFCGGNVDIWTTLFILDDFCYVLSGYRAPDPNTNLGRLVFMRVL